MELSRILRSARDAAAGITEGLLYATGYALGTITKHLYIAVDEAISGVEWGDDDD